MNWFNLYGFIVILIFMIPNIVFAVKCKNGFNSLWQNKIVEIFEQIGRYGCIIFMIINIPYTWYGVWLKNGFMIYMIVDMVLTIIYCGIWAFCFNKNSIFRALSLSILPSIIFLFSGIMLLSVPLIISAVIFAPCHILISYKNCVLEKRNKRLLQM